MPRIIRQPVRIEAHGQPPKQIEEFIGQQASGDAAVSIARMDSPAGWREPGQVATFTEYTLVLRGCMRIETQAGVSDIHAGQAVIIAPGEWVRYSTPTAEGALYIAVCTPAFLPDAVTRDAPATVEAGEAGELAPASPQRPHAQS